jgi:hypothetical protein
MKNIVRALIALCFGLLVSTVSLAAPVSINFTGYGSYTKAAGSQDDGNGIHVYSSLYFFGSFSYDSTRFDTDPNPNHGLYPSQLLSDSSVNLSWVDGYNCGTSCPAGVPLNSFVLLDGTTHQHSLNINNVAININNRDATDTTGFVDTWGVPFSYGGSGKISTSVEFALLDLYGPNGKSHLATDALGAAPTLEDFEFGSLINASRRETVCDPSLYAEGAAAGDPSSIAAVSYCQSTFVSDLHWTGQFATFSTITTAPSVPEPSVLALMCLGMIGLGLCKRMKRT